MPPEPDGDAGTATLEQGDISFLYRPRVDHERPRGLDDVQRLFVVMSPREGGLSRLLVVGRKRMPEPSERGHARYWGFVARVGRGAGTLRDALRAYTYSTRRRGERHQPGARPAGEGAYRIVRHADHTHLSYELFAPRDLGPVQEDLHVQPQATYILAVKNPARRPPPGLDAPDLEEARLPPELAHRFRGRRYAPADPPAFLDHEGTEFILIAAGDHARVGGERPDLAPEPRVLAELGLAPVGAGGRGGWDD